MRHHRSLALGSVPVVALLLASSACGPESTQTERGSGGYAGTAGKGGAGGSFGTGGASGFGGTGGASAGGAGGGLGTGGAGGSGGSGASGGSSSGGSTGSGGAPPADLPYLDDFEDGDTAGWIADVDGGDNVGNWAVVSDGTNHVYQQQTEYSDPSWAVGGNSEWTDQIVEARVQFVSSSSGDAKAFLAARLQSKDRYYFIEFTANDTEGSMKVRKRVDGSTTDIIPNYKTGGPVGMGTWYTLSLSAVGTTIKAYFNGTEIGSVTDSDLTAGGIALGVVDAVADFDDVKVSAQ